MRKEASFWEKEAFSNSFDLIIIGAGIVGLSSALFYKKKWPEARIVVLDRGAIPEGASTRNAGFACIGSVTELVADREKETEENIKKRIQRRYQGLNLLRKTLGDDAISYENCGGYELFTNDDSFAEASNYVSLFNDWMRDLIDEKEVYKLQKLNGYDVIYNRLEGALHPGKMMRELIGRVQSAGVTIYWNVNVRSVSTSGEVRLDNENNAFLFADKILLASNAFTKRLLPDIQIEPGRGFILVSEEWPDLPWKGTFHHDRGYIYFRNVGNCLLLGGGRNVASEEEKKAQFGMNKSIKKYLQDFARQTLHMPDHLDFAHQWSGIMGFTPTKTPVVQKLDAHRFVAAGLSGMGIAIGMDVAREIVEILSND